MGGIFHIDGEDRLIELNEAPYDSEERLQKLLEDYPELLAGDQISSESPLRWLLISREMGIPGEENGCDRWSVDHFFVDQYAMPTFVEVKRSSDTRIRREVVGQMLDYAANAVEYWPAERIRADFEADSRKRNQDPAERLADFIDAESGAEEFWQDVQTNLQAGKLRLLFVADRIPSELRRIVEFLNGQMGRTEVLAVEIKQYVSREGVRSLVPRVIGQTASAEIAKHPARRAKRQWDETSFMEDLTAKVGKEAAAVAAQLFEWARSEFGKPRWGTGTTKGFFSASIEHDDFRHVLFDVWTSGKVSIRFQRLMRCGPFKNEAARTALMKRFNEIAGVDFKESDGWPEFLIESLSSPSALKQFLAIISYMAEETRKHKTGTTPAA
jgi:hypothetical protein